MAELIGSYGLLGDTRTAALVSGDGSVDWMCVPRFDGDPIFGSLIDSERGGRWTLRPLWAKVVARAYADRATTLQTRWEGPAGSVVVREGMIADASSRLMPRCTLVRRVDCTDGSAEIETVFDPRLGLPGAPPASVRAAPSRVVCGWGASAVGLGWDRDVAIEPGAPARVRLRAGESITFVMSVAHREPLVWVPPADARDLLATEDRWWRAWLDRFDYDGPHAANVARSLITLRLLTYAPSGAPVAAPTTSIPAPPGSDQTWDYRFAWPRDASIGASAFLAFGSMEEPRAFLDWFVNAGKVTRPRMEVLYNLDGRPVRHEREIEGVSGYEGAAPVRIGNAAYAQHQLDVYGWVLDAAWAMHRSGFALYRSQWSALRSYADLLARRWRDPDNGVWEQREPARQYVHSKLMAWIGLDRALRLSASYPCGRRVEWWRAQRDALAGEIRRRGYNRSRDSYVQTFDGDELDASVLAVCDFDDDPSRLHATVDAIRSELGAGGALLYRYRREPPEGAFVPCSFWLVLALTRLGRTDEAEDAFDELCRLSSPLGLYAEQIDPATKRHVGNVPQAFSHATFLQAAAALNEARGTSRGSIRTARAPRARSTASARRS